jgi:hypothetical protein
MQLLLELRYHDPRLMFSAVAPTRTSPIKGEAYLREKIWVPHIFFQNEKLSFSQILISSNNKAIFQRIKRSWNLRKAHCHINFARWHDQNIISRSSDALLSDGIEKISIRHAKMHDKSRMLDVQHESSDTPLGEALAGDHEH